MGLPLPTSGSGLPPGLGAPPGGMPGAAPPGLGMPMAQGNPGNQVAAMMKVRNAVKLLEESLSQIAMDSPLHTKILTSVKSLLEAMPDESPDMAGPQQTNLLQLMRQQSQQAPLAALMRGAAGGDAAPPMPGGPPPGV